MTGTFASTISRTIQNHVGDRKMVYGTYTASGGNTGGDIDTGLIECVSIMLTATGSSIVADAPTVNETLPVDGSAVTVIVTSNSTGNWLAMGK